MELKNRTILVTGGNSGIGFATAKQLVEKGNKVIITGRDLVKLQKAADELGAEALALDLNSASSIAELAKNVKSSYPELSVLINNAGMGSSYAIGSDAKALEYARAEFQANYFGPIALTTALLPLLQQQQDAAIVNVSSNAAFLPLLALPSYSDSKAALRSYTTQLRLSLENKGIVSVHEVLPSLVSTEGTRAIGLDNGLPVETAAQQIISGIEAGKEDIFVGESEQQYATFLSGPGKAIRDYNTGLF